MHCLNSKKCGVYNVQIFDKGKNFFRNYFYSVTNSNYNVALTFRAQYHPIEINFLNIKNQSIFVNMHCFLQTQQKSEMYVNGKFLIRFEYTH